MCTMWYRWPIQNDTLSPLCFICQCQETSETFVISYFCDFSAAQFCLQWVRNNRGSCTKVSDEKTDDDNRIAAEIQVEEDWVVEWATGEHHDPDFEEDQSGEADVERQDVSLY